MWGPLARATSCLGLLGVNASERRIEFVHHLAKRQVQRGAPADQNVIVPFVQASRGREPDDFTQAAPHAIALHRIADLARHRKADARPGRVGARPRLQHERADGRPQSRGGSPKVRPALQPFHDKARFGRARARHALSRLRPRARRAATTLRPPLVAMRARKPWRRLRTNLLG
jgi:hypothetical protein